MDPGMEDTIGLPLHQEIVAHLLYVQADAAVQRHAPNPATAKVSDLNARCTVAAQPQCLQPGRDGGVNTGKGAVQRH